ncbi:hypothetical protein GCM10009801_59220 [Streptomyces albiaxialis]|uniref:Uncharacterized protein n=1 Tax=Streptomyces albiaxialis TaxID=329523 RepID=A0ABP5I2M7_9ACTN
MRAEHAAVVEGSRDALLPFFADQIGLTPYEPGDIEAELAWEACRAVLQGFALWWLDHRDVPRERVVRAAMEALWLGFARVRDGERWRAP